MTGRTRSVEANARELQENLAALGAVSWHAFPESNEIYFQGDIDALLGRVGDVELTDLAEAISYVHEDYRAYYTDEFMRAYEQSQRVEFDYCIRKGKTGPLYWLREIVQPMRNEAGSTIGVRGIIIDAHERIETERELQALRERHTLSLSVADVAGWTWHVGAELEFDPHLENVFGAERGTYDATVQAWLDHIHPQDCASVQAALTNSLKRREPFAVVYRVPQPDGSLRWLKTAGKPTVFDEEGRAVQVSGATWNVTAEMQARADAEQAATQMEDATRAANVGFWEFDAVLQTLGFDRHWRQLLGMPETGAVPIAFIEAHTHPDDRAAGRAQIEKILHEGTDVHVEFRARHADTGEWLHIESRGSPRYNAAGEIIGAAGVAVDRTREKTAQAETEALRERHEQTLRVTGVGTWSWLLDSDVLQIDTGLAQVSENRPVNAAPNLQDWVDKLHPDDQAQAQQKLLGCAQGERHEIRYRLPQADGSIRWILSRAEPIEWHADGSVVRVGGSSVEITAEMQARERADKLLQRVDAAVQVGGLGFWEVDAAMQHIDYDSLGRRTGDGTEPGPVLFEHFLQGLRPEYGENLRKVISDALRQQVPVDTSIQWLQPRTGRELNLRVLGNVTQDSAGKVTGVAGLVLDQTDFVRLGVETARIKNLLETTLNAVRAGAISANLATNHAEFTGDAQSLLGIPADTELNRVDVALAYILEADRPDVLQALNELMKTRQPINILFRVPHAQTGAMQWHHLFANLVDEDNSDATKLVGIIVDETEAELRRQETEILQQRYANAMQAAWVGGWTWFVQSKVVTIDSILGEIFDFAPGTFNETQEAFLECVADDERDSVAKQMWTQVTEAKGYEIRFRRKMRDGSLRWTMTRGRPVELTEDGLVVQMAGATWDIHDEMQARAESEAAQARMNQVLDTGLIGFWSIDAATDVFEFDRGWLKMSRYNDPREVPEDSETLMQEALHPDSLKSIAGWFETVFTTGDAYDGDIRYYVADDVTRYAHMQARPVRNDAGAITGVVGCIVDTDAERRAQHESERVKALLMDALESTRSVAYTMDPKTQRLEFIGDARKLLGLPPGPALTEIDEVFDRIHEDDRKALFDGIEHIMGGGEHVEVFHRIPETHFGRLGWQRVIGRPQHDDAGDIVGIIGIALDETEAVERRQELEAFRQTYDFAMRSAGVGNWTLFLDTMTIQYDEVQAHLLGIDLDTFDGKLQTVLDLFIEEDRNLLVDAMQLGMETGKQQEVRQRRKMPDGQIRWFCSRGANVKREDGSITQVTGATWDITNIAELNQALERSNRDLDDFAHIASHDLREPLRGIHNYTQFLTEDYADRLDDEGRKMLRGVNELSNRLDALLGELLHFSRIGRADMAMVETDVDALVRDVLNTLKFTLEEKTVNVKIPAALPTVVCDRVRVGELFRNLITNAIKYNDKAEKWIEIGYENGVFHVRDNGIGIAAEHIDRVFKIFKRLHTQDAYGGGTGAGLTIAKQIAERHGGRLWVESIEGEGSAFNFVLEGGITDK